MKAVSDKDLRDRIAALAAAGILTKGDLGLSYVDNTADLDKPVSSATQDALDLKLDASQKGASDGVASLDQNQKLPAAQLPDISLANGSVSDVQITSASTNQVLSFDGEKWVNAAASSGGGSANLEQNVVTVGVGNGTAAPQSVVLQGPQGGIF